MNRSLNVFILDEMIEQFDRCNPIPKINEDSKATVDESIESILLSGLLKELKVLRERCNIYESKIIWMERELRK